MIIILSTLSEPLNNRVPLSLGSLFDGIGGFMLAAKTVGITPVWASEIEPNCIAITSHHFPEVQHLGDIRLIEGGKIPPADIISFGSPCQDLSISNSNRRGLSGERSGLFTEAVRIIKEMRAATKNAKPRYAIWENVPGALNSNGGGDFRTVLEELLNTAVMKIGGDDYSKTERITAAGFAKVPKPPNWGNAGSIVGDNNGVPFSICWRVLDAQHFGIPQRRKRIFLVVDFGSGSGEEILFERESLSGDIEPGAGKEQNAAAAVERSAQTANTDDGVKSPVLQKTFSIVENIIDRGLTSGGNGTGVAEDICYTLTTASPHAVVSCKLYNRAGFGFYKESDVAGTLVAHLAKEADDLVVNLGSQGDRIYCNADKSCSITAQGGGGGAKTGMYFNDADYKKSRQALCETFHTDNPLEAIEEIIKSEGIEKLLRQGYELRVNGVRRLTPLECERLMGYEDNWTDPGITGKDGKIQAISDSARYRALGNSVAVPCVIFLLERLKYRHFRQGGNDEYS